MSTPRRLWPRSMGTPMMRTFWAMQSSVNRDSRESSAVPRRTEEPGKSLINSRLQEQREKRRLPALRIHAINHAREGDDLANVLGAANPGDGALEAHSEAGVGNAAVAAQVEIPLERFFGQVVLMKAFQEQIVVVNSLVATDDFAVAFRRDHVEGEGKFGALRVRLHVKGFDRCWVVMNQHGTVERAGDDSFFIAAEVVTELCGIAILVQNRNRIFVADTWERRLRVFKLGGVTLECFQFARFVLEDALDDGADEAFTERHDFVNLDVGGFGLEHPEFGEVTAGLGFFSAERRAEGVDLAEGHGDGFGVKLAALSEVGLLVVNVIDFEERGSSFAGCGSEHRRVRERVALAVHEFAGSAYGFGANAENGSLARRTNPPGPLIEQDIDAVFLELNGEGRALGNSLDDLNLANTDFVAARSALFRADFAGDNDAGFLRQTLQRFERFGVFLQRADALNDAAAVAENREEQLARFA